MEGYVKEIFRRGRLGAKWLASRVDENGYLPCNGDLGCYYKCVYPLRMAGYSLQASKMLSRVMELHYRDGGDLRNSDDRKTSGTYTSYFCQVYPNGWIIQGAFYLGQFDIVNKLMKGLMDNFYDKEMGTFRSSCMPRLEMFDVNSGAVALELFLLLDIEKAKRAADFLIRLIECQPDSEKWFYSRVEKPFTYAKTPDPRNETYSAVKIGGERQAYWLLGFPCAALVRMYEYTGEVKYLKSAEHIFTIFLSCGKQAFRWVTSGKCCWAAAMLYRLTGDRKYLEAVKEITEFLFSLQQENGVFLMPDMTEKEMGPKLLFDLTPEYVRWFLDISAELSVANKKK